jgi:putative transposase
LSDRGDEAAAGQVGAALATDQGMPRIPRSRLVAPGSTHHCFWRSHNRSPVLDSDAARREFLRLLAKHREKYGISILSYCVMGTHPHVVCRSALGQPSFSAFWKVVNQCFARWYNRRTGGRGQVVMERLGSPRIQRGGRHELEVMVYGDMNPVRAGMVKRPSDWPWSSHAHYAFGRIDPLVTESSAYASLGRSPGERRVAYLRLFATRFVRRVGRHRADFVRGPFIGTVRWIASMASSCVAIPDG